MNFEHTDDRRMLVDTLHRFVREKYNFAERQRIAASAQGSSREMWRRLAELGAIGALFPEASGGFGGGGFDIAVVFEAMGRGLVLEPLTGALMAGQALASVGTAAARTLLEELIAGQTIVLLAFEEAGSSADPARIATRAERATDGWRLAGTKAVVHQAQQADAFVVAARTGGPAGSGQGLSLFLVRAGTPGLRLRTYPMIDGGRGAELTFEDLALPASALLGVPGEAFATIERAVGCGLLALSAESLGAMDIAKQATLEYLRTRRQFGVPIGSFQALQHRMVDLLLEIEQARSAVINAAAALEAAREVRERALAAAKVTVGRAGALVAEECIQMHGGIGMTWELPLAHYAKRLVMIDHELGDEDYHLARFIALDPGIGAAAANPSHGPTP
ncbi:Acyl-CoA dehydrogenase [Burkholderiales bacterium]|nr:Acyl-CoA dehydrogenase [Burkholderiales bacterium]